MRKYLNTAYELILLVLLFSCQTEEKQRLDAVFHFAENNRPELEKVLTHYAGNPEKQAAACFLIENMLHKFGYTGWQLDSILPVLALGAKERYIQKETIAKWNAIPFYMLPKAFDAKTITSDYLIENIDLAFDVYKKYPWNRHLPFNEFCELILPYRIGDEPLSSWRREYHDYYTHLLDSLYPEGTDVVEACHIISADLEKRSYYYNTDFTMPRLSAAFLFNNRIGYCREACDITIYAMRSCGIPVAIDQFIYSPEYQHSHMWCVVRDTTGRYLPFWFSEFEASRTMEDDGRKKGKVYRNCFGIQEEKVSGVYDDEHIPATLQNPFIKDETANYTGQNEVTIIVDPEKEKYAYLGIFSPRKWIPIDISEIKNGKTTFRNIEPDLIYLPLYSDGRSHRPASYPVVYHKNGEVRQLLPDFSQTVPAVLKRKMPLIKGYQNFLYDNIIGARIETSVDPDFKKSHLLHLFDDTLRYNRIDIFPLQPGKFRYLRYVSPSGKHIELAELACYQDSAGTKQIPLKPINEIEPVHNLPLITDGDILTYIFSQDTSRFIAFDMGTSIPIGKIFFSPRNDDNFIYPGDRYALFYQDGVNGWKLLEEQTATGRELHFNVPSNALLWLRDLTKGREEQVFYIENGKQVFAYDIGR